MQSCNAHRDGDVQASPIPHLWPPWDWQDGHLGGGHQAGEWLVPRSSTGITAHRGPWGSVPTSSPPTQVWTCFKDARILACAPSNSAADLLCQRLIKDIAPRYIYRLIASSRSYQEVPADIRVGPCPSVLASHNTSGLAAPGKSRVPLNAHLSALLQLG